VAGKAEMRRTVAPDRDHVLGRSVGRLAHCPAVAGEAERGQRGFEHVEHSPLAGVTLGQRISSEASATGSIVRGHPRYPLAGHFNPAGKPGRPAILPVRRKQFRSIGGLHPCRYKM
jgi:hypothetical protein